MSLSSGEMPLPVSATEISTNSASGAMRWRRRFRGGGMLEGFGGVIDQIDDHAAQQAGRRRAPAEDSPRDWFSGVMPSRRSEKTSRASRTMVLASVGTSLAVGKRTNWENSLTSAARVETSRSIRRGAFLNEAGQFGIGGGSSSGSFAALEETREALRRRAEWA